MRFIIWLRNLLSVLPGRNQCLPGMLQDLGIIRVLESVRHNCPDSRLYQASSSGMFGKVSEAPQNENTPFYPRSPHGFAKVYGYWACINCRESYRMHASNGILFNHESPRYGIKFMTRKITYAMVRIKLKMGNKLRLGNLNAKRDRSMQAIM